MLRWVLFRGPCLNFSGGVHTVHGRKSKIHHLGYIKPVANSRIRHQVSLVVLAEPSTISYCVMVAEFLLILNDGDGSQTRVTVYTAIGLMIGCRF